VITRKGGNIVTIPLAPRTARAIDLAIGERCEGPVVIASDGRRLDRHGAGRIVRRIARRAAITKPVGPHTLRHAFITAAQPGHEPGSHRRPARPPVMSMTLTYARIADRTVADEYFAVSQQVEALYGAEPVLPAGAGGPNMRRLHTETTRRLLGNGYCTRPADLGCRYETMCETAPSSPPPSNSATNSKPSKPTRNATATPAARTPT